MQPPRINFYSDLIPKEPEYSINSLIDWLVSKTFLPFSSVLNLSKLPQESDSHMNELELGEIKMILIEYLSKEIDSEKSILISCKLFLVWYREFDPQTLQIPKLETDQMETVFLIKNAISQAKKLKENFGNHLDSLFSRKFGDSQPSEKMKLPNSVVPQKYIDSIEVSEMKSFPISLVKKIETLFKQGRKSICNYNQFEDIPVIYLVRDQENIHSGWFKIAYQFELGRMVTPREMLQCVNSLIAYLIQCHGFLKNIISIPDGDEKKCFMENSQENLMNWIEKIFFGTEIGMPIFGKVEKIDEPLVRSRFSDIQISLIYYFSSPRSISFFPEFLLVLLVLGSKIATILNGFIILVMITHLKKLWNTC
jgi:hypothetical protein